MVLTRMRHQQKDFSIFENTVRDQEVGGSNPLAPTILVGVRPGDMGDTMYLGHR